MPDGLLSKYTLAWVLNTQCMQVDGKVRSHNLASTFVMHICLFGCPVAFPPTFGVIV